MRRFPLLMLLPLLFLSACQSTPPPKKTTLVCSPRLEDAGQCNKGSSISSFPELANVN